MKFDRSGKVWEAASKDTSRPVLTAVYLNVQADAAWLEATDSYMLVRIPCEAEAGDTSGLIPVEALKEADKASKHETHARLDCTDAAFAVSADGLRRYARPEGTFPNAANLIPNGDNRGEHSGIVEFGINPLLLTRAAKALGAKSLRVTVGDPRRPITVAGLGGVPGAACIIMPVRIANSHGTHPTTTRQGEYHA